MNVYGARQDYRGAYIAVIMKMLDAIDRGEPLVALRRRQPGLRLRLRRRLRGANVCAMKADADRRFYNVGTGVRTSIARARAERCSRSPARTSASATSRQGLTFVKNRIGDPTRRPRDSASAHRPARGGSARADPLALGAQRQARGAAPRGARRLLATAPVDPRGRARLRNIEADDLPSPCMDGEADDVESPRRRGRLKGRCTHKRRTASRGLCARCSRSRVVFPELACWMRATAPALRRRAMDAAIVAICSRPRATKRLASDTRVPRASCLQIPAGLSAMVGRRRGSRVGKLVVVGGTSPHRLPRSRGLSSHQAIRTGGTARAARTPWPWAPLRDVGVENRDDHVMLRTHLLGYLETEDLSNPRRFTIADPLIDDLAHEPAEIRLGEAILYSPLLVHRSRPNRSGRARATIQTRFSDAAEPRSSCATGSRRRRPPRSGGTRRRRAPTGRRPSLQPVTIGEAGSARADRLPARRRSAVAERRC